MSDVVLLVNGTRYDGWENVEVQRSMRAIASRFSLTVSERYPGDPRRWQIAQGDECELLLDGQTLITGFVDSRAASFSAEDHTVTITGRDRTGDMVDSAPEVGNYEFAGLTALQVCQRLGAPFGVTFRSSVASLPKLDRFDVQPGETAFETASRACQLSAVLPIPQGDRSVVLDREGSARAATALREGDNILAGRLEKSDEDRFHSYIVMGQHFGSDTLNGEEASGVKARATDPNIRTQRVLLLRPSGNLTLSQAAERARWEAANRSAAGVNARFTVQGWTQGNGTLWPINTLIDVVSPTLAIDAEMLITAATFSLDASGTRTALTLAPPGSFKPEPVVPESSGADGGIGWEKYFQ